jgi:hypothetical protein
MATPTRGADQARPPLAGGVPLALHAELSALYERAQDSRYIFASPLGPLFVSGRAAYLPRFVFFGPNASDDSWRVCLYAGLDRRDLRGSKALLALASLLAADSAAGHGLNLTFIPVVDVGDPAEGTPQGALASAGWGRQPPPEIALLAADARQRGYHGFVTVETAPPGDHLIGVCVRGSAAGGLSPGIELVTPEETRSFSVRMEPPSDRARPAAGPLSLPELPVHPFALTLRIPGSWPDEAYQHAAATLIERILRRYRAYQAHGQHL